MEFVFKLLFTLLLVVVAVVFAHLVELLHKKRDKMSFKETMDICDLPLVTFINNGKKINFLLDTGASKSAIHEGALKGLIYTNSNMAGDIYGIDGKRKAVAFIDMTISYNNKDYKEEFQVLDLSGPFGNLKADYGVNLHGILSSTFFQRYKYVLNFDELVAYSIV